MNSWGLFIKVNDVTRFGVKVGVDVLGFDEGVEVGVRVGEAVGVPVGL